MGSNKSAFDLLSVEPHELALLLPVGYIDASFVITQGFDNLSPLDGREVLLAGVCRHHGWSNGGSGRNRYMVSLTDSQGCAFYIAFFGDTDGLVDALPEGGYVGVQGKITVRGVNAYLSAPTPIPENLWGRVIPSYPPVRGRITRDGVFSLMAGNLRNCIPLAEEKIRQRIRRIPVQTLRRQIQCRTWTLSDLITKAHWPKTIQQGKKCIEVLDRLAAAIQAHELATEPDAAIVRAPLATASFDFVLEKNEFPLTSEQIEVAERILADMRKPQATKNLLLGDVGYGKSYVIACVIGAVVAAGGRVAVMMPSVILAQQMYDLLMKLMSPELAPMILTDEAEADNSHARLWVGTTGLTFRQWPHVWDLVVVDEQQRFSVDQREKMLRGGAHLLEATATPICRTMALSRYGSGFNLHRLTQSPVQRHISSAIVTLDQRHELFSRVMTTISQGGQVLIVCPKKEAGHTKDKDDPTAIANVNEVYQAFERVFDRAASQLGFRPVTVTATGSKTDEENDLALSQMKSGQAHLLIATTIVETGVNIPSLRHVVIYNAERLGAVQLHQLRGRLSRSGGYGVFDMYLPKKATNKTLERLNILVAHTQGYDVAMADMRLRGFGDLSGGTTQAGSGTSILPSRPINIDMLESILSSF